MDQETLSRLHPVFAAYEEFQRVWRATHPEHESPAAQPSFFAGYEASDARQAARYAGLVEAARALHDWLASHMGALPDEEYRLGAVLAGLDGEGQP